MIQALCWFLNNFVGLISNKHHISLIILLNIFKSTTLYTLKRVVSCNLGTKVGKVIAKVDVWYVYRYIFLNSFADPACFHYETSKT